MPRNTQLDSALARLESRWGRAAVRIGAAGNGNSAAQREPRVVGSLALAPQVVPAPDVTQPTPLAPLGDEILPTGFPRLDALLGVGGLPRGASASLRGGRSSGKTALALHCIAQAQARGGIAAFLDLARVFDPLEAVGRGVDLRWLLVLRPRDVEEGFALAAALLSGRQVDLLVVDLPARLLPRHDTALRRLAAHARRAQVRLVVLETARSSDPANAALAEVVGLRLELEQRTWLRLGHDVVGRRVAVTIAKNRFGPPGRRTEIEIRYLTDGEHAAAAARFAAPDPALIA
jgi:RecA/RadA recombinase